MSKTSKVVKEGTKVLVKNKGDDALAAMAKSLAKQEKQILKQSKTIKNLKGAAAKPIREGFKHEVGRGAAKATGKVVKYGALGTAGYFGVKSLTSKVTGAVDSIEAFVEKKLEDAGLSGDKAGFWSGIAGNVLQGVGALASWNIASAVKGIPLIGTPLSWALTGLSVVLGVSSAMGLYEEFNKEAAAPPPPSDKTLAQKTGLNLNQNKVAPSHQPNISQDHKVAADPEAGTPERSPRAQDFNNQVSLASADRKVNNTPAPQHELTTLGV